MQYKKGKHCVFYHRYHLVWSTKYRYKVLRASAGDYAIVATPAQVTTQSVFYYVDQTRVIRAKPGAPADGKSDVFWSPLNAGWGR